MATAIDHAEVCALDAPASRRFYIHVGSLGFLVAAQPSFFGEVAHALALSGASRALDQVVQDWTMFSPSVIEPALPKAAGIVHSLAADALRTAFQCIVQLVPPRFGATELLLGSEGTDQRLVLRGWLPDVRHRRERRRDHVRGDG